jgi:hypothetical protein
MKRIMVILIMLSILFSGIPSVASAKAAEPLLDPTLLISINGEIKQPTDGNGNPVYPILYNDTIYLPLEGASYLLGRSLEWDSANKTVKITDQSVTAPEVKTAAKPKKKQLTGVRPDPKLKITYNGKAKQFYDANGKKVYPIYTGGTMYISIRSAAILFGKTVEWDAKTRTLLIKDPAISVNDVRIVIDGKVNTFNAKLIAGDWYLKPADIKTALGINVTATMDGYANLRTAAKKMDVSYEHDGILNAAYLWTDEKYAVDVNKDYNRAISLGLVPGELKSKPDDAITPKEFGKLLTVIIDKIDKSKVKQFKKNVLPALSVTRPMLRGEGFIMAYYAAECVGADDRNNEFDQSVIPSDQFWDAGNCDFDGFFPYIWTGPVVWDNEWKDTWQDYHVAAFLWAAWRSSPVSNIQVFEYDAVKNSMRQTEQLTVREAVSAAVRIYDRVTPDQYMPLSNTEAVNYDKTIITDELLNKSKALPLLSIDNLPVWKGFVLSGGGSYENTDFAESEKDLRNIANWGFNSVRIMMTYQTLFDEKAKSVNISNLQELDKLIAAAIKYNLHVNLLTFSLPGRWTKFDFSTYQTTASLDLFTNPERQKEANAVWALLAARYKDIPSATLSFCPIWEAQNYSLSSGLYVTPYTEEDVAKVYGQLLGTIKQIDPDRFVIFEPTANNSSEDIIKQSDTIKEAIQSTYPNALMMANFCETPFVYAEMTATAGAHIDHNNHSMFKPAYPTTIYAAQYHIDNGSPLEMNGVLKAGTKIDIYLSKADGDGVFEIAGDGKNLYSENLSTKNFNTEDPLSGFYPYAKSDKLVSITLKTDVEKLLISYSGNYFEWSGINITLPDEYAVKRWWFPSGYDALLTGTELSEPMLKDTSTIMISPNSYNSGRDITVNADVTYTSSEIIAQSNKQTIESWAKAMTAYSPKLIVRFETAGFSVGCIHDSVLKYYDDMLSAFDKYGIGWYSNDYMDIINARSSYAGIEPVQYKEYSLDVEMLKVLQKHQ